MSTIISDFWMISDKINILNQTWFWIFSGFTNVMCEGEMTTYN